MNSIRKWFYRPKREDPSKLVQFYYADDELNLIATELDSFDGHKDPERCSSLVNQLRLCQDKVLNICNEIMDEAIPLVRANRDYRIKFPDEMLHENLAGQLWFGAECLAAGSSVANREVDSEEIRPLAKAVTKALDDVRNQLREQCLKNSQIYSDKLKDSLAIFDHLFAEFEFRYVHIMVPIKTLKECHLQQEIIVLFSETLQRAFKLDLITQDMIDDCDPSVMIALPRLAIVCGLIIYPDGPLNVDNGSLEMSYLFLPFYDTLCKIRELLWTLSSTELSILEKNLCNTGDLQTIQTGYATASIYPDYKYQNYVSLFLQSHQNCQQFIQDFYGCQINAMQDNQNIASSSSITETWQTQNSNPYEKKECLMSISAQPIENKYSNKECKSDVRTIPYIPNLLVNITQFDDTDSKDNCCCNNTNVDITSQTVSHNSIDINKDFAFKCNETTNSAIKSRLEDNCVTWSTEDTVNTLNWSKFENEQNVNCVTSDKENFEQYYEENSIQTKNSSCYLSSAVQANFHDSYHQNNLHTDEITRVISTRSSSSDSFCDVTSYKWQSGNETMDNPGYTEDEAIALALQAAEIASRNEARSKYKTSEELIHKLFVDISGAADQLQTTCAGDLRNMLKSVFEINSSHSNLAHNTSSSSSNLKPTVNSENNSDEDFIDNTHNTNESIQDNQINQEIPEISAITISSLDEEQDERSIDSAEEAVPESLINQISDELGSRILNCRQSINESEEPPSWLPDEVADHCMACHAQFTLLRRRHHCRNCGKIFCSRCSAYSVSLPRYGHSKPVRVCHQCFIHQMASFMVA